MLIESTSSPLGKSTLGAKVGVAAPVVVVLMRMEVVLLLRFPTARSSFPSKLRSPMLTERGSSPAVKCSMGAKVGVVAPVVVVLMRMEVVLLLRFVVATSGEPSPLKSPMLTP